MLLLLAVAVLSLFVALMPKLIAGGTLGMGTMAARQSPGIIPRHRAFVVAMKRGFSSVSSLAPSKPPSRGGSPVAARAAASEVERQARGRGSAVRHTRWRLRHGVHHPSPPLQQSKRTRAGESSASTSGDGSGSSRWLIVGLGNPGTQYDGTRHNVGFQVVDALALRHGLPWSKSPQRNAQVAQGRIEGHAVVLVKPMTFMNKSGEAVAPLAKMHNVGLAETLVVYDDIDLPVGTVRLRSKGGHGGHNGMRSMLERLGQKQDFPRIKVGVGRPESPLVRSGTPLASGSASHGQRPDTSRPRPNSVCLAVPGVRVGFGEVHSRRAAQHRGSNGRERRDGGEHPRDGPREGAGE